jgi:hypothetical protein
MMTPNYGRKYITIIVDVKLYFSFFWTFDQKSVWAGKGKDRRLLVNHDFRTVAAGVGRTDETIPGGSLGRFFAAYASEP